MDRRAAPRYAWLDWARGLAMAWIFMVHAVENAICCPLFGNPGPDWPSLAHRVAQMRPIEVSGASGVIVNALRYIGWSGDIGVQMFLVASGIGLTVAALRRPDGSALAFYRRRLLRILPIWWVSHFLFLSVSFAIGGMGFTDWRTWASLLGLRWLPQVMYYFAPAWWFFGLIIQLYAVFPLLLRWLERWSLVRFLLIVGLGSVVLRGLGLWFFSEHASQLLDWWSRGALFISRLPEFAFGMAFGALLFREPERARSFLGGGTAKLSAAAAFIVGVGLLFSLPGLAVAMVLTGGSIIVLLYAFGAKEQPLLRPIAWFGRNSLGFFLVHHTIVRHIGPTADDVPQLPSFLLAMLAAFALSLVAGTLLERLTDGAVRRLNACRARRGLRQVALSLGAGVVGLGALALSAELAVRHWAPQEVLGWGERSSLQKDEQFGFRLIPDRSTRLRWLSYDYVVQANDLGFPGPHFPYDESESAVRVLVTGDAFESAEGVDTPASWPRRLEAELTARVGTSHVSNFSVTGWGPNQYAEAVREFAPSHRPDVIIVAFFANDFADALISNEQFQRAIGFQSPPEDSLVAYLKLVHLKAYVRSEIVGRLRERLTGEPRGAGLFFGYFTALERSSLPQMQRALPQVRARLRAIQQAASRVGARVVLLEVPAPAQVCGPESVDYYPPGIDLASERFDLEQPQRLLETLCSETGLDCLDLRPPLRRAISRGPCQRNNLHWTESGHEVVARFVADELLARRWLRPPAQ